MNRRFEKRNDKRAQCGGKKSHAGLMPQKRNEEDDEGGDDKVNYQRGCGLNFGTKQEVFKNSDNRYNHCGWERNFQIKQQSIIREMSNPQDE